MSSLRALSIFKTAPALRSSSLLPRLHPGLAFFTTTTTTTAAHEGGADSKSNWRGSTTADHATNTSDELDVQSTAAQTGKAERVSSSDGGRSQAVSEQDEGKNNARAKQDHAEAPGPVIGMNDERGSKGY
ncbi:MAG: hypothetical protein M1826_004318 [Phylliscum demangeonii]|nr:MAG: hypothetical protein M1826_004318 [Phylliscum demangeonii]